MNFGGAWRVKNTITVRTPKKQKISGKLPENDQNMFGKGSENDQKMIGKRSETDRKLLRK